MQRWRRHLVRAMLLLVAGAVVNVAVAWACYVYSLHPNNSIGLSRCYEPNSFGRRLVQTKSGLPLRALLIPPEIDDNWSALASDARGFTPLPTGFAINTVFYAAILWALFAVPFVLRRRRRIKRGLCPACAYPVGEGAVCTERGTPVKRHEEGGMGKRSVGSLPVQPTPHSHGQPRAGCPCHPAQTREVMM
jgi:hypothetical protein